MSNRKTPPLAAVFFRKLRRFCLVRALICFLLAATKRSSQEQSIIRSKRPVNTHDCEDLLLTKAASQGGHFLRCSSAAPAVSLHVSPIPGRLAARKILRIEAIHFREVVEVAMAERRFA